MELGCINYPIYIYIKKNSILRSQVKKRLILSTDCAIISARYWSSDRTMFRAFIIYFVCCGFQLSNPLQRIHFGPPIITTSDCA